MNKTCFDQGALQNVTEVRGPRRPELVRVAPELEFPMGIVARSRTMIQFLNLARRVARVDSTVLLTGESGAGKERIAKMIHDESDRAAEPFIRVNVGAIPETLLESELFGHARGAFTGATQQRPGLFEAADHGTLLLDEIGEIPPALQVKLLRAIQEREIRRIGENQDRPVDVRIIAATNRDLAQAAAAGGFRHDLYYRLKVVELRVPALREREDDILPLARALLAAAASRMKREVSGFAPAVVDRLMRYAWPGNVRELQNAMERAAALAPKNRVELADLPDEIRQESAKPVACMGAVRPLDEVEKEYILAALALNGGNQTHTARQLRIGTATLHRKLKGYALDGTLGHPAQDPAVARQVG
jgi:two-component system, NtrC family, response regulator HydG